jgi:hypothetical protein
MLEILGLLITCLLAYTQVLQYIHKRFLELYDHKILLYKLFIYVNMIHIYALN